jgi:WD40 repeat protein
VNNLARLALAPDGKSYAINTGQCVVRDAATHEVRYTLKPDGKHEYQYRNGPYPPLYSADGKLVALHGVDGTLRVVDVASGKEVRTLRLEEREPSRPGVVRVIAPLAFSPNGRWLLVSTEGMLSELILFGVASGLEVRRFPGKVVAPGYGNMAISPAGNLLAVPGGSFDKVEIWDMEQGQVKLKAAPGK